MNLAMQTVLVDLLVVVSLLLVRYCYNGPGATDWELSAGVPWKRPGDRMQRGCYVVGLHGWALHSRSILSS